MAMARRGGEGEAPPAAPPALVRVLRWALFLLLLATAAAALVSLPRIGSRGWPGWVGYLPVGSLTLFIAGYAVYRFVLVRSGRYPAGQALVRVGAMLLALGVIAGIALDRPRHAAVPAAGIDLSAPLASPDPTTRALAAELVRWRPRPERDPQAERLLDLLDDPAPEVRRAARASLVAIAGADAGEGPGAAGRWRALLRARGLLRAP